MLYQLAYVSLASQPLDQKILSQLLTVSQHNNERDDVSGVLMYQDSLFFQILEGERDAVQDCYYKRICKDSRHSRLSLMWENAVDGRTFPDLAMEYLGPAEIGGYTKNAMWSLVDFNAPQQASANTNSVALNLARLVFAQGQGSPLAKPDVDDIPD